MAEAGGERTPVSHSGGFKMKTRCRQAWYVDHYGFMPLLTQPHLHVQQTPACLA